MRKLALLSMLAVLAIALFAATASAQLTVTAATLGGSGAKPLDTVTTTVTVANTGTSTITGITMSTTAPSGYNITFTNVPSSLAAGASQTVTINAKLAENTNAVDASLDDNPTAIGNIVATGNNGTATVSGSNTVSAQVENHLEIKKVIITVNGEEEHSLEDGDDLDDLKPGDKLEIRVELENTFNGDDDDDEDIDFQDAKVNLDVDSDIDLDDDSDEVDVDADSENSIEFEADIDDEASGSYTLEISVEATGSGNLDTGRHGQSIKIDLDVERESHEILIRSATLSPATILCGKNSFDAKVKIVNLGKNDEDEVAIEVVSDALGVNQRKEDIQLDENDETLKTIPIVLPTGVKAGTYSVDVNTFWNNDIESDSKTLTLTVEACAPSTTPTTAAPTQPTAPPVVSAPPTTTGTTTVTSSKAKSASFWDSGAGIATMILGIIAVLVILVFLVTMLVKKPAA